EVTGVKAEPAEPAAKPNDCGAMTPEVELGAKRSKAAKIGAGQTPENTYLVASRDGELNAEGRWTRDDEALLLTKADADLSAALRLVYRGARAFSVLGRGRGKPRVYVRQDRRWLHPGNAGKDISFDDDGRSYVAVGEPRLFELLRNPDDSMHELSLSPNRR